MKTPARLLFALIGIFLTGGCRGLDLTPETDPDRAVAGTITMAADVVFPPDAELVVRVIDTTPRDRPTPPPGVDVPIADRGRAVVSEVVLGEQIIRAPGHKPIPFRVEFRADDATMRRGVNIDARISEGGKVRYRTLNAHLVTLGSVPYPHEVVVEPLQ
jgi:uncharacterized lipoprotein YbaY